MTQRKCVRKNRNNNNFRMNTRIAWDDLRAMTPFDPYTDFPKPRIGYILDDDDNYPEGY